MKIAAGLGSIEDYEAYVEAGADELFCGVVPIDWLEKYGMMMPLNRREVLLYPAQIASMTDMRLLARLSLSDGIPVAVTFNSACYAPQCYPMILDMIKALMDTGIERFIVADPALMMRLPEGARLHVSGEFGEFSRATMDFLRPFHPARLIFHRKVTPEEMRVCTDAMPGMEYEAFILNERCYYTGAMCSSLHCDEMPHICKLPWKPGGIDRPMAFGDTVREEPDPDAFGASGCGLCAIPQLEAAGITHLKLVGRGNRPERMIRDIRLLRQALNGQADAFSATCAKACYY